MCTDVRANYSFDGRNNQELSFKAGDIIEIISRENSANGWWEGRHSNGKVGFIPCKFFEEITVPSPIHGQSSGKAKHPQRLPAPPMPEGCSQRNSMRIRQGHTSISNNERETPSDAVMAEVISDFAKSDPGTIDIKEGDLLVLFKVENPWCYGYNLTNKTFGAVPQNYVATRRDLHPPSKLEMPREGAILFAALCSKSMALHSQSRQSSFPSQQQSQPQYSQQECHRYSQDQQPQQYSQHPCKAQPIAQQGNLYSSQNSLNYQNGNILNVVKKMVCASTLKRCNKRRLPPPSRNIVETERYLFDFPDPSTEFENDKEGNLKGASLFYLIGMVTSKTAEPLDPSYFLLTYRNYTDTENLLDLLNKRLQIHKEGHDEEERAQVKLKVFSLLKELITVHRYAFNDTTNAKMEAIKKTMKQDEDKAVQGFADILTSHMSSKELLPVKQERINTEKAKPISHLLDISPVDFAQQLTAIENDIYQQIQPPECYDLGWTKVDANEHSPNILKFIDYFNKIGKIVTSTVLNEEKASQRRKCIEYFLKVSNELLELKNFNATMEIISALGSSPISRLKKTWTEKLEQQFQPFTDYLANNFSKLRKEMEDSPPPLLPYIGVFMKDLMMIEEGNDDYTESNLINWQKMKMQGRVIYQIITIKNKRYILPENHQIENLDCKITEDEAFNRSLELEPRK